MELIHLTSHLVRLGLNALLSLSHEAVICGITSQCNRVHSGVTSNFSAEAYDMAFMSLSLSFIISCFVCKGISVTITASRCLTSNNLYS